MLEEKSVKHWLKRKVKVTEALLVAFLITGGIASAEETVSKAEFDALKMKVEALEKYKVKFVSVKVDKEGESVINSTNEGAVGIMSTAVGPSAFSGQDYSLSIGNYVHNCGKFATQIGSFINLHQMQKKHTKDGSDVDTRGMFSNIVGSLNWMYLSEDGEFMGDVPESELVDGMDNTIVGSLNYTLDTNGSYILGSGNIVKNSMLDFKELVLKSPAEEEKSKETFLERLKKYRIDMKEYGGKTTVVGKGNEINGARRTSIQGFNNKVFGDFTVGEEDGFFPDHRKDTLNKAVENILIMGDNHKLTKVSNAVIVGSSDKETETTVSDIVAVGHNTQVKNEGGIALGNGSISATDKGKQGFDAAVNAVSAKDDIAWKSTRAALSVGDVEKKVTRQITGVAAGTEDTDAVNVAQLKALSEKIAAGGGAGASANISAGNNIVIKEKENNGKEISLKEEIKVKTVSTDSINVGDTVKISKEGINAGKQKITNVADGKADSDAVNVKQLNEVKKEVKENTKEMTKQLHHLGEEIDGVRSEARGIGALSASLAALHPMQYDKAKPNQVMAGVGTYRDKQAVAVGMTHYFTENLMMTAGVSLAETSNTKAMANVGLTWKFGKGDDRGNLPEVYKEGPISSIQVMQDKMMNLENINKEQQTKIEMLEKQVKLLLENR